MGHPVLCTFNEKSSDFFQEFFVLRGVTDVSLSLAYYLVIAPINILLKSSKISGSSSSSDSEITSGKINPESNERHKRKVKWYNILINGSSASRKFLKLSNIEVTDWTNNAYNLLRGCLNAFPNLFSVQDSSSGSFSESSSKSKFAKKCDSKKSRSINVFSKYFHDFIKTWLITFLISQC